MLAVYWTRFAEKKLDNVFAYYSRNANVNIAKKLVVDIINKSITLENSPYIGQIEPLLQEREEQFRYLIYKNYKLIYWVNEPLSRIEIINLFDCRQNPDLLVKQVEKHK
jgi:plasmid stabilization system protein ParE